ncbi:MAG: phosphatase PAP2 family protein [Chlamydiales bacterium]
MFNKIFTRFLFLLFLSNCCVLNAYEITVEKVGDIGQIAIPLAAAALSAGKQDYEGLKVLAYTSALTLSSVYALKYSIDAKRPYGGRHSFPSGHTAGAFMGASYLQRRYGWTYGVPAYAAASFVGYSRVKARKHFTRDVLGAACIALGTNYLLTKPYENATLAPVVTEEGIGIQFDISI